MGSQGEAAEWDMPGKSHGKGNSWEHWICSYSSTWEVRKRLGRSGGQPTVLSSISQLCNRGVY